MRGFGYRSNIRASKPGGHQGACLFLASSDPLKKIDNLHPGKDGREAAPKIAHRFNGGNRRSKNFQSFQGRQDGSEQRAVLSSLKGLHLNYRREPSVKTLGYFRKMIVSASKSQWFIRRWSCPQPNLSGSEKDNPRDYPNQKKMIQPTQVSVLRWPKKIDNLHAEDGCEAAPKIAHRFNGGNRRHKNFQSFQGRQQRSEQRAVLSSLKGLHLNYRREPSVKNAGLFSEDDRVRNQISVVHKKMVVSASKSQWFRKR